MKRGLVISDLHLFAPRSDADALLSRMDASLEQTDVLVLNGDTFDFRWSRFASEEESVAAALRWLADLTGRFAGNEIHYILGNHDCLAAFRAPLGKLVRQGRVLQCHELRLQLDRLLFLHGDCANRKMDGAALERFRDAWSRDRPRGAVPSAIYGVADSLGVSRRFHQWYFPESRAVKRVAHHLDDVMPAWRHEVDDCFFGHTHVPFRDYELDGVRFHNTGSGIRGMGFQPTQFEIDR